MTGLDGSAADSAGFLVLDFWLGYRQENIEIGQMSYASYDILGQYHPSVRFVRCHAQSYELLSLTAFPLSQLTLF